MNGIKFLLDTNIILGLLKGNPATLSLIQTYNASLVRSSYSFITRIELLGYPRITQLELQSITALLRSMQYLPMTTNVEEETIQIRRQYALKTPDAIIAATAKVCNLELITLDTQLASRMSDILQESEP